MLNSVFYWRSDLCTPALRDLPRWENLFLLLFCLLAILRKEKSEQCKYSHLFFPLSIYLGNIFVYSLGYSFERYNAGIITTKYIAIGIGIGLFINTVSCLLKKISRNLSLISTK